MIYAVLKKEVVGEWWLLKRIDFDFMLIGKMRFPLQTSVTLSARCGDSRSLMKNHETLSVQCGGDDETDEHVK